MWEQSLCESGAHARGRSLVFLAASATAQLLLLAVAVILPLTRSEWMPYFAPPLPLAAPTPAPMPPVRVVRAPAGGWRELAAASEQPLKPLERAAIAATPATAPSPGVLVPGAIAGPALGLPTSTATIGPPPAAPPATPVARGGDVEAALCLACPPPAYPAFARQAHVEGTVVLQAVIGADGRVAELRVVSGPALLAGAARRAVQEWRYRPLVLDGRAVPVTCDIAIRFKLGD